MRDMMRILGLDIGERRIGVAISDGLGITAQGLQTLMRNDADSLSRVIKENDVREIVVGLPVNMDGTQGERAKDALLFADSLKKRYGLPVTMWDERLSTAYVERAMIEGDLSRRKRKALSDRLAAQVILQGYLDQMRSRLSDCEQGEAGS